MHHALTLKIKVGVQWIVNQLSHSHSEVHQFRYFINILSLNFLLAFLFQWLDIDRKALRNSSKKIDYLYKWQKCKKSSGQSNTSLARIFPHPGLTLITVNHFPCYSVSWRNTWKTKLSFLWTIIKYETWFLLMEY